jgi:FdhE protein
MAAPPGRGALERTYDGSPPLKQGGSQPAGKWTGPPVAGVSAPLPLILPTPKTRFADTARRLATLAPSHPAASWLSFVGHLAGAQQAAALSSPAPPAPSVAAVEQAVDQRAPPLWAARGTLDPAWRDALKSILGYLHDQVLPAEARGTMEALRAAPAAALDRLATAFLDGEVDAAQLAQAFYVAAALQVHFTRLAAGLPVAVDALRLLPQRGFCPCCGAAPVVGVITASGRTPGVRYLHCSLCSTAWNHVRTVCIHCGEAGKLAQESIEGAPALARAETCGLCGTYSKLLDARIDPRLDPVADDLASLGLDMLVTEAGWARHAPNPLLLVP